MGVNEMVRRVRSSGLTMRHDLDAVTEMVRAEAVKLGDPEGGWFMADVLNAVNELEMEEEE